MDQKPRFSYIYLGGLKVHLPAILWLSPDKICWFPNGWTCWILCLQNDKRVPSGYLTYGKWWKMMNNDGKWWKMMENDSLIDDVWCFAYVLTCYLSLRLKNKKTKQQLGYVFGCRDSMLIPQIPLSSKAHVPASQERPRAGDESRWIPKGKWTGNCRNPFYEAYIGWKKRWFYVT